MQRLATLFAFLLFCGVASARDDIAVLEEGHWVEIRGTLRDDGTFVASKLDLTDPGEYELLIGTVEKSGLEGGDLELLEQRIRVSPKTEWKRMSPNSAKGSRVKIEGRWHGPLKFSAREISPRGEGRERIGGRIDSITQVQGGLRLQVMRYEVFVPNDVELELAKPVEELLLAPQRVRSPLFEQDEDDTFGRGIRIMDDLYLSGQFEIESNYEDNYDLDSDDAEDRTDFEAVVRARLTWEPTDKATAVVEGRGRWLWRDDQDDGSDFDDNFKFGETYLDYRDLFGERFGTRLDVIAGRQDFDEHREWIYDQNLDGVRLIALRPNLRLELSASTTLSDGSERDKDSFNLIGYLSNNNHRRHLAAWAVYRDIDDSSDEQLLFYGARGLGSWLPANESWLEISGMYGEREDTDLSGWGFDVGTTWEPELLGPFNMTLGYAFGTGDDDPDGSSDGTFRQTGFQDNNDKFAGVTSFRYYGEVVDPELANLGIFTAGVGARVAEKTSLDLVFHKYRQDEAFNRLFDSNLDQRPNGQDRDIGWGVDLIFGSRRFENWDLEVIGGYFDPGDAFPDGDDAYLGKIQLRYRF